MDDFKAIYKILSTLQKAMDYEEFDPECISHERVGLSEERWKRCMEILADEGFVKNVVIDEDFSGVHVECGNAKITLAGLEYLEENKFMKKAYRAAKGLKDVIPGA